jgi:nicotinate dehydrogenase subunit A
MSGDEESTIGFVVNGTHRAMAVDRETALLYVLRNDLGLKGTKFGCGTGLCGACMVLVDGRPITSCDLPIDKVAGRSVTTIEGLGSDDALDPVQTAMIEEDAGQCGYCLSGIIVSAAALLEREPNASVDRIGEALDAHVCRCGAHPRIIRAIRSAGRRMRP